MSYIVKYALLNFLNEFEIGNINGNSTANNMNFFEWINNNDEHLETLMGLVKDPRDLYCASLFTIYVRQERYHSGFNLKMQNRRRMELNCDFACSEYHLPQSNPMLNGSSSDAGDSNLGIGRSNILTVNILTLCVDEEAYSPNKVAQLAHNLLIRFSRLDFFRLMFDMYQSSECFLIIRPCIENVNHFQNIIINTKSIIN